MTAGSSSTRLSSRARLTWLAHLFKSCVKQHHRELITSLRRFIPEDAVVLDVGGHAGQFAKLFARMAAKGHVYTVEHGSYALSILRPAVRFNRLRNITILPVGVSDSPSTATLQVPVKKSGSIGYGLGHIADFTKPCAQRPSIIDAISLTTIDRIAVSENLKRLDFIKADIEGWEFRMIVGAEQTLLRFRPALWWRWSANRSLEPATLQNLFSLILRRLIMMDTSWNPNRNDFIRSNSREATMFFLFRRSDRR